MSDPDPKAIGIAVIAIFIALATYNTATDLLRGQTTIGEAFTPGWLDFAAAHPLLFIIIVGAGMLIFGRIIVQMLEAM